MVARDIISNTIPALKTSDTGKKALNWMEIFRISHLPIVNNQEFLGLISDSDIYDFNDSDQPVGNHHLSLIKPFVRDNQHLFEIITIASMMKLTVIPVLDDKNHYLGVVLTSDLIDSMAKMSSLKEPGGIIVLTLTHNDYSLSQIAQIVESNDAKVLNLYITSSPDSSQMEITLKLNTSNLLPVLRTFERFSYDVAAWYSDSDEMDSFYGDRFGSFMKFLDT